MKLQLSDVSIGYDKDKPIQRHIGFTVNSGEVVTILGPNGCGKTTLVKTILGMQPLLGGTITFDGDDVTKWSARRLSDAMAYVAQKHEQPFPYMVRDVVLLGRLSKMQGLSAQPTADDYNIVENAMADMGIWHLRDMPYSDISGGELQMVMFARALAQEPQMLILDEPTAALDYGNAMRVVDMVRRMADLGYGVVMITHDPNQAFMTDANVALFMKAQPMRFGPAEHVITRANIKDAYGVGVKVIEVDDNGMLLRMCAPERSGN